MPVNGKTRELRHEKPPPARELGTPFPDDALFGDFENGKVFDYDAFAVRDFDEMLSRDGKARTVEQALCLPIIRTPWDITPAEGDTGQAEKIKKMLTLAANAGGMSIPIEHVIAQATSAFAYRKAFFEKVFKPGAGELDGLTVYDKIAWRPTSSCQLARDAAHGGFAGFRQRPRDFVQNIKRRPVDWINIPTQRSWVYIHGQGRDPLKGYSDLEVAMWCYRTKQKIRFLWYSFLEGQALPRSTVTNADIEQAKRDAQTVASLKNSGVAAVNHGSVVDVLESSGKGAEQFIAAIRFLDSEMSGSVLAGFTDLTSAASEGKGSFALSKDSSDFFLKSRQAALRELQQSINDYVIADLCRWNWGPESPCPRFTFGQLAEADVADAINLLTAMAASTANNLPADFTYMLASKVAEYLDLDTERLERSFEEHAKEKEEQARAMAQQMNNPAMAAAVTKGTIKPEVAKHMTSRAGQVGRAAGAVDRAAKLVAKAKSGASLSEYQRGKVTIDLASKIVQRETDERTIYLSREAFTSVGVPQDAYYGDDGLPPQVELLPDGESASIELAAVDGHHVPGTAYHWFHEWKPRYAAVALKYRKGKHLVDKLTREGKIHPVEPDWYQGLKPGEKTFKEIGKSSGETRKVTKYVGPDELKVGMKLPGGRTITQVEGYNYGKGRKVTISWDDNSAPPYDTYLLNQNSSMLVETQQVTIGLHPPHQQSAGTEGGAKLPFEGKGQKSKPAKKIIKQAEEYFGKDKDPDETPQQKLGKAKADRAAKAQAEKLAKAQAGAYQTAKFDLEKGNAKTVEGYEKALKVEGSAFIKAEQAGIKKALDEYKTKKAEEQKLATLEQKSYESALDNLYSGTGNPGKVEAAINAVKDSNDPSIKVVAAGMKKALDEYNAEQAAKKSEVKHFGNISDALDHSEAQAVKNGKGYTVYKNGPGSYTVQPLADDPPAGAKMMGHHGPDGNFYNVGATAAASAAKPSAPKSPAPKAPEGKGWKTKQAALNNAQKKSKAENVNYFAYQGADGNWHITKDKSQVDHHGSQPAQVAKPFGAIQPFDPDYDAKFASGGGGVMHPAGKKLPKGAPTGQPIKKVDSYQINMLPPIDPTGQIDPDETLWGSNGQIKLIDKWWREYQDQLTPAQRYAIQRYTGSGYQAMNGHLRGEVGADEETRQWIRDIDEAMQPLPTSVQVTRGVSSTDHWPSGGLEGQIVRDLGYGSTSFTAPFGGTQLHLTVPAGVRAMPLLELSGYGATESELLIERGASYKIVGDVIDADGRRHITAVVLPPPHNDPYDVMAG